MSFLLRREVSVAFISALTLAGCGSIEDTSSEDPVANQVRPSEENLSRTWLNFTYDLYLLDRLIEEHGHEDYIFGSEDSPYVTDEDGRVVSVSNFDFLEESGVVDEVQGGYSVNTDVDLGEAVERDPEVRVSVKTVLSNTVSYGEMDWCETTHSISQSYGNTFHGSHNSQDEARAHMVEFIDSCGSTD